MTMGRRKGLVDMLATSEALNIKVGALSFRKIQIYYLKTNVVKTVKESIFMIHLVTTYSIEKIFQSRTFQSF